MWHIDTPIVRLLDGTRAYVHAVIDNFSRRIWAWRVADTFAPVNSVAVLVEASRSVTPSAMTPSVLADAGVKNVNAQVDDLDRGIPWSPEETGRTVSEISAALSRPRSLPPE